MKQVISFLIVVCTALACNKESQQKEQNITSAWKETDYYYSIGGPIIWKQTGADKAETIRFKEDNIFYSSAHPEWNRYVIEPPQSSGAFSKLKIYGLGQTDTTFWFIKEVSPEVIEIGFSGCIEGCGKRFSRVDK
jgi:hypothetical protein